MADPIIVDSVSFDSQNAAVAARPGSKELQNILGEMNVVDDQGVATPIGGGGEGTGTVTSVAATALGLLAVAGTPTVAPTVGLAAAATGTVCANLAVGSAVPTMVTLAALATALGLPNFGSDTSILLPNSLAVDKTALQLVTTLSTNTSGAEVSRWVIRLLRAGAQLDAYTLTPNGLTVNTTGTTWTMDMQLSGVSQGTLSTFGTVTVLEPTISGGEVRLRGYGYTALNIGAPAQNGIKVALSKFQQAQGTNATAANLLIIADNGSGSQVAGNTQINEIYAAGGYAQRGFIIWLRFTGTPTLKHNNAVTSGIPIYLKDSVDWTPTAGSSIQLVAMGASGGSGAAEWFQELSRTTA